MDEECKDDRWATGADRKLIAAYPARRRQTEPADARIPVTHCRETAGRARLASWPGQWAVCLALGLQGCAAPPPHGLSSRSGTVRLAAPLEPLALLNRATWGATASSADLLARQGAERFLHQQLYPARAVLPPSVQTQIDAMTITGRPIDQLIPALENERKQADALPSETDRKAAQQAYRKELSRLAREATARSLLMALYSPNQLQEQMTWFWLNHFNVHQYKHNLRAMVGDYEDRAIRPHALGRFRDLLAATIKHPAMLRYLDNDRNAAGHLNENYARELLELHTLGADGGYVQRDVQELARVLTGVGVALADKRPNLRKELEGQYVRQGLFEFNPARHDYGDKVFLGQVVKGRGLVELDEVIDRLARHPATARFVCRKIAIYLVSDSPPAPLVERMAQGFLRSDGDIAATLRTLFESPEFASSLEAKFKDPVHFVLSAVRLAYDDKPILNAGPIINWLNRLGQPPFGRQTPDGYDLKQAAWDSPGQMNARFEVAKTIGGGSAGLFKGEGPGQTDQPAFPQLANPLYYQYLSRSLSTETRQALAQATSPQEWNSLILSSPEFMRR